MRYAATGRGKAKTIQYLNGSGETTELTDVELPWGTEVRMPDTGDQPVGLHLSVQTGGGSYAKISCTITANGTQVAQNEGPGFAVCTGSGKLGG